MRGILLFMVIAGGCSNSHGRDREDAAMPVDTGPRPDVGVDARRLCTSDMECRDDSFCNGIEVCAPGRDRADERGCVPGELACIDGLICTVEGDPACDDVARMCSPVVLDHSACPAGRWCRPVRGCIVAEPCPSDGSPCEDTDPDPCRAPACDDGDPPLCVSEDVPDGTPCATPSGIAGTCQAGMCNDAA